MTVHDATKSTHLIAILYTKRTGGGNDSVRITVPSAPITSYFPIFGQ